MFRRITFVAFVVMVTMSGCTLHSAIKYEHDTPYKKGKACYEISLKKEF